MKLTIREAKNPKTGKPVTIISNIIHNPQVIEKLASKLKSSCGTGGHVSGKEIHLNGSLKNRVIPILEDEGYEISLS